MCVTVYLFTTLVVRGVYVIRVSYSEASHRVTKMIKNIRCGAISVDRMRHERFRF